MKLDPDGHSRDCHPVYGAGLNYEALSGMAIRAAVIPAIELP
jgi:hypothetical protein